MHIVGMHNHGHMLAWVHGVQVGFIQDTKSYAWVQQTGMAGVQASVITMKVDYVLRIY